VSASLCVCEFLEFQDLCVCLCVCVCVCLHKCSQTSNCVSVHAGISLRFRHFKVSLLLKTLTLLSTTATTAATTAATSTATTLEVHSWRGGGGGARGLHVCPSRGSDPRGAAGILLGREGRSGISLEVVLSKYIRASSGVCVALRSVVCWSLCPRYAVHVSCAKFYQSGFFAPSSV